MKFFLELIMLIIGVEMKNLISLLALLFGFVIIFFSKDDFNLYLFRLQTFFGFHQEASLQLFEPSFFLQCANGKMYQNPDCLKK